jgi:hypothetical protein
MKLEHIKRGAAECVVLDDFYSLDDVDAIKLELQNLQEHALGPESTATAKDDAGAFLKRGSGVFLDVLFDGNRDSSAILTRNRKLFDKEVADTLVDCSVWFGHVANCNIDHTLVNFYSAGEEYKTHFDANTITVVSMFRLGDFQGGELAFPTMGVQLECKDNRVVLFPGCLLHCVLPTESQSGGIRASVTQFLGYRDTV